MKELEKDNLSDSNSELVDLTLEMERSLGNNIMTKAPLDLRASIREQLLILDTLKIKMHRELAHRLGKIT